jgi:DNA-binding transcriptional ArsR family regulator
MGKERIFINYLSKIANLLSISFFACYYLHKLDIPLCTYVNVNRDTLSQEINQLHANICSAISEPSRILLLYALSEGSRNVKDLAEEVNLSQSAASRHLKVLRERGLIQAQKDGSQVIYSLVDDRIIKALDLLRELMIANLAREAELVKANQSLEKADL